MIVNSLVGIVNWLIDAIDFVIGGALDLLPDSPFLSMNNNLEWGGIGRYLGYFFDIPTMTLHFSLYVTAIGAYYLVRMILRWLKAIQ